MADFHALLDSSSDFFLYIYIPTVVVVKKGLAPWSLH